MVVSSVYKYRLYCETEEEFRYVWGEELPTICPSGIDHIIDSNSISIVDVVTEEITKAEIVDTNDPTEGYFKTKFLTIESTTSGWSELEYSWNTEIALLGAQINTCSGLVGDEVEVLYIVPDPIGIVTLPVSSGNVIEVSETVVANINKGLKLKVSNGIYTQDLGEVLSVDLDNKQVIVENEINDSFGLDPVTYVYVYAELLGRSVIGGCGKYTMERGSLKSKTVPVGHKILIRLNNKTGDRKFLSLFTSWTY